MGEPSGSGIFMESFVLSNSISIFVIHPLHSEFVFLLESVSIIYVFLGICTQNLSYIICWQIVFIVSPFVLLLHVVHLYILQTKYITMIINLYNFMFTKQTDKEELSVFIKFVILIFLFSIHRLFIYYFGSIYHLLIFPSPNCLFSQILLLCY